jgi:hypothetical protein
LAGWGRVPFEANGNAWLTVYIIAPPLGGLAGGAMFRCFFKSAYASGARVTHADGNDAELEAELRVEAGRERE